MGGGNLDTASTKFRVNMIISDNGDLSIGQRQFDGLTNQFLLPFIIRVNGDSGVAEHSFRTGSGHHKMVVT